MMKYLVYYIYICFILLSVSCQQKEMIGVDIVEPDIDKDDNIVIEFAFTTHPSSKANDSDIISEESKVERLIYAIFQNNALRENKVVDFGNNPGGTSLNKNYYTIQIPKKWLDSSTEIYAVANASPILENSLLNGTYQIPDNYPPLQDWVSQRIDSLARADIYTSIIERSFRSPNIPKDGKIHRFPAKDQNWEYPAYFEVPQQYRFNNYDEFLRHMNDPSLPLEMKKTFDRIWVDLQCRIVLYRGGDLNNKIAELTRKENTDHAIRTSFQSNPNLQKHLLWQNMEFESDLNREAAGNLSKWIEKPLMAGMHALNDNFPIKIIVPVERVYSRIWFNFHWDAFKETDEIVIDEIIVNGLVTKTRLFNMSKEASGNNPSDITKVSCVLKNHLPNVQPPQTPHQHPFIADLMLASFPYHIGDYHQMLLHVNNPTYSTLSVYHELPDGTIDQTQKPHRCYVYSYQLFSNSFNDDPEIVVKYHFKKKSFVAGETGAEIYKKAVARLYDETHYPGKQHHGLLRNYTYQLNCKVTSLTNTIDVQVVAVPWYKIAIDDIPEFE